MLDRSQCQTGQQIVQRQLNIQPTLTIRPGFPVRVIVTHDLESIFKIAKHCIMLDKQSKSIIARGDPRELRDGSDDPRVKAFFNRIDEENL